MLNYTDDGRGLNLETIKEIAKRKRLITEKNNLDRQAIAELILTSGFSTTNMVTEISGRGVGMDAVRKYLEDSGGFLKIELAEATDDQSIMIKFSLKIALPSKYVCDDHSLGDMKQTA